MLNELVKEELQEIDGQEYEGFKVTDIKQANWCFRKISAFKKDVEDKHELAEAERLRIDTWEKKETEVAKNSIAFFEGVLKEYFRKLREQDPKAKVSTPYGKISSRKSAKWNYVNEEELLKYLKDNNPELIKTTEEVKKPDLKKEYKDGVDSKTGELLPGVEVSSEESISIKVD